MRIRMSSRHGVGKCWLGVQSLPSTFDISIHTLYSKTYLKTSNSLLIQIIECQNSPCPYIIHTYTPLINVIMCRYELIVNFYDNL